MLISEHVFAGRFFLLLDRASCCLSPGSSFMLPYRNGSVIVSIFSTYSRQASEKAQFPKILPKKLLFLLF